jgi:hypothetical protein
MQKSMELMNIKLTNVISDILGKSGQAIIRSVIEGERDVGGSASPADPRCKSSKETIEISAEYKPKAVISRLLLPRQISREESYTLW